MFTRIGPQQDQGQWDKAVRKQQRSTDHLH
jgi:hypothetical protein